VKTIRGWFRLRNSKDSPRSTRQRACGPISTFRRLEKRRVFAVDAFFVGGALDIEITGLGQTNANLLVDGTDFFVDSNNNLAFEVGEIRGAITGLQSVHVFSNDSVGKLLWNGDFSLAPLAIPLGTGDVVRIEGLREVHLQAPLNADGNVSINAIDSIDFNASIFIHGNLTASVSPSGTILDGTSAAVLVSGDAVLQSDNTIQLADESTSSWNVVGITNIESKGDIELGLVGNWDSSTIRASGDDISVRDQNSISIIEIHSFGNFGLNAFGNVNDQPGANIDVAGTASIQGTSINFANDAGDVFHVSGEASLAATTGSVSVASQGNVTLGNITASGTSVTLFEDADTTLASIQTPGVFSATSTGSITDIAGASIQAATMNLNAAGPILLADNAADVLNLSGAVSLVSASSVTIASPGTVTLGNITASGNSVTLFEDADTTLASIQTPGVFSLTSTGSIADVAGASILAAMMNLNVADSVLLADNTNDVVSIGGRTFISATNRIDIESAGSANFGSLGLIGKSAVVYEDSTTQLDGSFLGSLELHARGNVSQSGMDTGAGTSVLQINGPVHVSLLGSPGNIDLFRARINPTTVTSDGQLLDNQISGVFTADGINGDFRLRNASSLAAVGLLVGSFDDLTIWHPQASIVLPNQVFNILGDLDLIAGADVNDPVPLNANPINRILNGNASISDAGSKLTVGGDAHFVAAAGVEINDAVGEILTVTSGSTSVISLGGDPIVLGNAGTAMLSELGIYSRSILDGHLGDIVVQVDSSVTLNNPSMPTPDGRQLLLIANNAAISGTGELGNTFTTQLFLGGNFEAVFNGNIILANNTGDTFRVVGFTKLTSESGSMELGQNGTLELGDVVLTAPRGEIAVGGPGRTELGVIDARGIDVSIQEDTSMVIRSAIASNRISLSSDSSILNTVAFASNGAQGISANELRVSAGTFAHLGSISVDRLTATVLANGRLNDSTLFTLNATADQNGQSYLDAVRENLPPGVAAVDKLLSGETLNELKSRASFVQSFGKEYGLFVHNNKELTVEGIDAMGDGIHVFVETERGFDLIIDGNVSLQFTAQDPGGVVLVAGDHLILTPRAELRIEHISRDISASRVIKQPNLIANAFDGARGPAGFESTRDVLYESDAFADTGTQNVLQRVSTQFGVVGESGFQTLVRYADGKSQLFDSNQELYASLQSIPSANSKPGVIPAFLTSAGDAAVVERKIPFSDTFLGTFQTLPTSAVFRRSSEFFLFENAGAIDSSLVKVDLTQVVDLVDGVLSPGRKISFPMPTEIVVNPAIQVAPIRIAPGEAISYASQSNDVEPSVLSDAKFEVFIVNVGFDDANSDGQPSDTELPSRSDVQIDAAVRKTDAIVKANDQNDQNTTRQPNLAPGEPNISTKEIRGSAAPSAAEIERWIEEYRDDPTKPSGAYAIISVDSVTGANVLKVFGVRDFEASNPNQPADNNESVEETESKADDVAPKDRQGTGETSSDTHKNAASDVTQFELQTTGAFAGTMLTVSNNEGNRFGRLARSLRAACRIQAENQNGQVS